MLEDKLESVSERQLMYGEGTRYNYPCYQKKKGSWKKKVGIGLITAGILGAAYSLRAHEEPDFSKLPDVKHIYRVAFAYEDGVQVDKKRFVSGTAFKIGEANNKSYYATAQHLKKPPIPVATNKKGELLTVVDNFLLEDKNVYIEGVDENNDVMIFSVPGHTSDEIITQCKEPVTVGDQTYVYGYHRGFLGLSEGRIGNLEIEVLKHKDYYVDADVLGGASGAPHLKYENGEFCVFGMVLGNIDHGFFGITRDIEFTNRLYSIILSEAEKLEKQKE